MAVLVVEDVFDVQDILALINYLACSLASGNADSLCCEGTVTLTRDSGVPSASDLEDLVDLQGDDVCYDLDHRYGCTCQWDAANTDPRQPALFDLPLASDQGGR